MRIKQYLFGTKPKDINIECSIESFESFFEKPENYSNFSTVKENLS